MTRNSISGVSWQLQVDILISRFLCTMPGCLFQQQQMAVLMRINYVWASNNTLVAQFPLFLANRVTVPCDLPGAMPQLLIGFLPIMGHDAIVRL